MAQPSWRLIFVAHPVGRLANAGPCLPAASSGRTRVRSPSGNRFRVHAAWHQGPSIRMFPTLCRRGASLHAAICDPGIVIRHAATLIALEDI